MLSRFSHWLNQRPRAFVPSLCMLCGRDSGRGISLCAACAADLPWHGRSCATCAARLPEAAPEGALCGACLRRPSPLAHCRALFAYQDPVARLLTLLKFGHDLAPGAVLGALMAEAALAWPLPIAGVLAVPLPASRLKRRGFNQAQELAAPVARALGVPLLLKEVSRQAETAEQSGLSEEARKRNLRRAFTVLGPLPDSVLLVDDVTTTGTTLKALALTLQAAGVAQVSALVAAKTRYGGGRPS
ncbi:MAG: ComF family protein [Gammaproteobacteria bacterium]|nr:ComF family protein [Gammaproteobacteria bacterium]